MDIQVLQNFLHVARTLHFTKASQDAFIAQPALSRQIKHLEETLGVELFRRNKRNVELTSSGIYFKAEVERLLSQWEYVCKRVNQIHNGEAGEIRIGYTHSALQNFLPETILQLNRRFPNVKTIMFELTNLQQVLAVEKKELEIGFTTNPLLSPDIRSRVLLRDSFVVVLPVDHPVSAETYTDFSVFSQDGFILPPRAESSLYVSTIESICLDAGFLPRIVHETPFASTGLRLVEAGIGITIEPLSGLRAKPAGVKYFELSNIRQKADLTMIWHKTIEIEKPGLIELLMEVSPGSRLVD